jgi:predicted PhzF superfamily epimerase YddE/YHI9
LAFQTWSLPFWKRTLDLVMIDLEYRHVDVFSQQALGGNGLTVVLDSSALSSETMQNLTREFRQFETAFLTEIDLPTRSAHVLIFT